jgi:hypothetical protein
LPARRKLRGPYADSALLSVSARPNSPSPPSRWESPLASFHSQPGIPPSIPVERVNGQNTPTVTSRRGVDAIPPIEVAPPKSNKVRRRACQTTGTQRRIGVVPSNGRTKR